MKTRFVFLKIFLILLLVASFLVDFGYAQFVSPGRKYFCRGEVVSFTEHFISVREKNGDEELQTFKIDDNTKIDGEISKGSQVEITYVRKEEAISGRVKLATKIKVEKQKEGKQD